MTLDELQNELAKDLPIDPLQVQWESGQNPVLYGKYLRYMSDLKVQQRMLVNQKSKAYRNQLDYYTGRGDEVCMTVYEKSEMKTVLSADEVIMKADSRLFIVENMIDFCKGALEAIKIRGFSIKAIIDQRSLESGK